MPASSRRRGSAATFTLGVAAGLPFCSGGNLRTGSAIALLFLGRLSGRVLNRIAYVFLDGFELGEQAVGVGGIDALERGRREFGTQPAQLAQQRPRGVLSSRCRRDGRSAASP